MTFTEPNTETPPLPTTTAANPFDAICVKYGMYVDPLSPRGRAAPRIDSVRRTRKPMTRCYEIAGRAILREPEAHRLLLVHGTLRDGAYPHAWIDLPDLGLIYDPTYLRWVDAYEYTLVFRAAPLRRYTAKEAAAAIQRHRHFGPWPVEGAA